MNTTRYFLCNLLSVIALLLAAAIPAPLSAQAPQWEFRIRAAQTIHQQPFTGRVYVFFKPSRLQNGKPPKSGPDWFSPQPMIAKDVTAWTPGEELILSLNDVGVLKFPRDLTAETLQWMDAQAVVRANPNDPEVGDGPGNWHSQAWRLQSPGTVAFDLNQVVPERKFTETNWTKLLRFHSTLLSDFYQRDFYLQAAVTLPASYYSQPTRRYPVILEIPGFSGTHIHGIHHRPVRELNNQGVEFIRVMLDPSCPLGHHVFANSANNGPCMDAFFEEFLPSLEAAFRTDARPEARFLTGHSSGGWSSLWLLINHPEEFAGTWSTSPDSVSFKDFQLINLERPGENMFHDQQGERRPIVRRHKQPVVYYDTFSDMEVVLGPGCQLMSFEAVFSPRGTDGLPARLWNRTSGMIDPKVAAAWKQYDILERLESNWDELGPRLAGKIHIFMGTLDSFYLDGATRLMKDSLSQLGSDAEIELLEGRDHMNLFDGGLDQRIEQEMATKYRASLTQNLQNAPESTMVK